MATDIVTRNQVSGETNFNTKLHTNRYIIYKGLSFVTNSNYFLYATVSPKSEVTNEYQFSVGIWRYDPNDNYKMSFVATTFTESQDNGYDDLDFMLGTNSIIYNSHIYFIVVKGPRSTSSSVIRRYKYYICDYDISNKLLSTTEIDPDGELSDNYFYNPTMLHLFGHNGQVFISMKHYFTGSNSNMSTVNVLRYIPGNISSVTTYPANARYASNDLHLVLNDKNELNCLITRDDNSSNYDDNYLLVMNSSNQLERPNLSNWVNQNSQPAILSFGDNPDYVMDMYISNSFQVTALYEKDLITPIFGKESLPNTYTKLKALYPNNTDTFLNRSLAIKFENNNVPYYGFFTTPNILYVLNKNLFNTVGYSSSYIQPIKPGLYVIINVEGSTNYSRQIKINLQYVEIPIENYIPPVDPDDPNPPVDPTPPGGGSTSGGGGGNFDNSTDSVINPVLPSLSARASGIIGMYNPTAEELQDLNVFLWSPSFIDSLKRFFSDPADMIINLAYVNYTPPLGIRSEFGIGTLGSGIEMTGIREQFMTIDCGSITVDEYWGNFLDYNPNTQIEIYLPYIGIKTLNTDDVMGATLNVKYNLDIMSGDCVAFIRVTRERDLLDSVLYSYNGNVNCNIPINSRNYNQLIGATISGAATLASIGTMTQPASPISSGISSGSNQNISDTVSNIINPIKPFAKQTLNSAMDIISNKRPTTSIGSIGGSGVMLGIKKPYIIIHRPIQSIPENYQAFHGYPSNITSKLSELSGYTEVEYFIPKGFPNATANEMKMIAEQLNSGVIL